MMSLEAYVVKKFYYNAETGELYRHKTRQPTGTKESTGYLRAKTPYGMKYVHRIIWFLVHNRWPNGEINHKDFNRQNNRLDNLEEVTKSKNISHSWHVHPNACIRTRPRSCGTKVYEVAVVVNGTRHYKKANTIEEARKLRDELRNLQR